MVTEPYELLIGGTWRAGDADAIGVLDKFTLEPFASVTGASREQITQMVDVAHTAFRGGAPVAYERGRILDRAAALLEERHDHSSPRCRPKRVSPLPMPAESCADAW